MYLLVQIIEFSTEILYGVLSGVLGGLGSIPNQKGGEESIMVSGSLAQGAGTTVISQVLINLYFIFLIIFWEEVLKRKGREEGGKEVNDREKV